MSEKVLDNNNKKFVVNLVKSVFISLAISVVGILLFAVVLKFVELGDFIIKVVNQIIKIISIFFGVKLLLKSNKQKGILKGFLLGVLYTFLCYIIFSILSSSFSFGLSFIFDVLFSCIFGVVFGIILVNTRG